MQKTKLKLGLILMATFLSMTISAQNPIQVIGVVVDENKESLVGVNIFIKGQKKGTVTDYAGNYKLSTTSNATLVFSYIGMNAVEVPVNKRSVINVTMQQNETMLSEVVAIGYGNVKRPDLTGSVGSVNMTEMIKAPVQSIDQALGGRIAGLNVIASDGAPGSEATVTIRGGNLSQDAAPLYVIDGFPMENFSLNTLDPKTIENIDVLKDASSIAIYGSRGANGVIIINTKKGTIGKSRVSYSYNYSVNVKPNFIKVMNPYDYVKMQLELEQLDNNRSYFRDRYLGKIDANGNRERSLDFYRNDPGTDWAGLITRDSPTNTHSLTLNGGTLETKYNVNIGYMKQDAVVINTGMDRYTARGSIDQILNNNLRLTMSANHTTTKSTNNGALNNALRFAPTTGLLDIPSFVANMEQMLADGTLASNEIDYSSLITPLQQAQNEINERTQAQTQVNAKLEWKFLKYFTFSPSGGVSFTNTDVQQLYNSLTTQGQLFKNSSGLNINTNGNNAKMSNDNAVSYLSENIIGFKRKFNSNHNLDVIGGFTYQYSELTSQNYSVLNIAPEALAMNGIYAINAGQVSGGAVNYMGNRNQLTSFLGRANYNIMEKYLFTASARYDGSSKFAPGHQWGLFPSGAFAWRFSNEGFMKPLKNVISDAKLRASYGQVGNNRGVNDFSYLVEFGALSNSTRYMYDGKTLSNGVLQYFLRNQNLTWETTTELDLGIDLTLLKNRISFSVDYYHKVVDGLLMPRSAPYYLGYANNSRYENVGSILNEGAEFTLVTNNINSKKFNWTTNFNFSYNNSKVISFYEGSNVKVSGSSPFTPAGDTWIAQVGGSTSQFYGYKYIRLFQESDFNRTPNGGYALKPGIPNFSVLAGGYTLQPGDPMFADLNGDGKIDDNDRTTLGSPTPPITGGLSNTFSYGNFSLNLFFQYTYGNVVANLNRNYGARSRYSNSLESYVDRWTLDNTNTDVPRLLKTNYPDVNSAYPKFSSRIVEDGSFIRFKTASITYRFPQELLKKIKVTDLSINFSAQNIWIWTKYTGQDPEVNNYNTYAAPKGIGYSVLTNSNAYTSMTGGLDQAAYPKALVLNIGANITF